MFFEKKADFFKKINCCLSLQKRLAPAFMRGVPQCAHWGGGSIKKARAKIAPLRGARAEGPPFYSPVNNNLPQKRSCFDRITLDLGTQGSEILKFDLRS